MAGMITGDGMVRIKIRRDPPEGGVSPHEVIDPDDLSPKARAMLMALVDAEGDGLVTIWMESDRPRSELYPNADVWFSAEEAAKPDLQPWSGWAPYRHANTNGAVAYLEAQAAKIPEGWHVYGATPRTPRRGEASQHSWLTRKEVLTVLSRYGRDIMPDTWSGYVTRGDAPPPHHKVGRTAVWDSRDVEAFGRGEWSRKEGRRIES